MVNPELSTLDVRIFARLVGSKDILWQKAIRLGPSGNPQPKPKRMNRVSSERMQTEPLSSQPQNRTPPSVKLIEHNRPSRPPARQASPRSQNSSRSFGRRSPTLRQAIMQVWMTRLAIACGLMSLWFLYRYLSGPAVVKVPAKSTVAAAATLSSVSPNASPKPSPSLAPASTGSMAPPQFQGKSIDLVTVAPGNKVAALTFDDGPWPNNTEKILDILSQENIKATFYWVGRAVQNSPDIAKKVVAQGHAIGNHTWRHPQVNLDEITAAEEIANTAKVIYDKTGVKTNLFRPPGGNIYGQLVPYAKRQKYSVNMWDVESADYYASASEIVRNVVKSTKPGSIILLHDGGGDRKRTIQALPLIILQLKEQGYSFVTVPELMAMQAPPKPAQTAKSPSKADKSPELSPTMVTDPVALPAKSE